MEVYMDIFVIYLCVINFITFLVFAIDKQKAVNNKFRIREATLLGLAAIGGSVGGLFAMRLFRHKIRKKKFTIGMPLILVIQITVIMFTFISQNN